MLVFMHDNGEIDDDEFLAFHEVNRHGYLHVGPSYWKYERFNLDGMREYECEVKFWFKKQDIARLFPPSRCFYVLKWTCSGAS